MNGSDRFTKSGKPTTPKVRRMATRTAEVELTKDGRASSKKVAGGSSKATSEGVAVGAEVRALRKARQITLPQLSEQTGYSTGFLSQVERGISSPSVDALHNIASALGVSISWFFRNEPSDDPDEREYIVRSNKRRSLGFKAGITDELLSPHLRGQLELLLCKFPAGTSSGEESYTHRGEEAGVILQGRMELFLGDRSFVLEEGDSFGFSSSTPHRYRNIADDETIVIWAITPPTY